MSMPPKVAVERDDDTTPVPNCDYGGRPVAGTGRPRPRRNAAHGSPLGIGRGESSAASREAPAAHESGCRLDQAGQGDGGVGGSCKNLEFRKFYAAAASGMAPAASYRLRCRPIDVEAWHGT